MDQRYFNPEDYGRGFGRGRGRGLGRGLRMGCPYGATCPYCPYGGNCPFKEGFATQQNSKIEEKIIDFFRKNPKPTDAQVHALATKLRLDKHKFEEIIYRMLGKYLNA